MSVRRQCPSLGVILTTAAVGIACIGAPASDVAPASAASGDPIVIPEPGACEMFALRGMLLFRGTGSGDHWRRRVAGQTSPARGLPAGAFAESIGVDGRGRVVAALTTVRRVRWWRYDVAARSRQPDVRRTGAALAITDVSPVG